MASTESRGVIKVVQFWICLCSRCCVLYVKVCIRRSSVLYQVTKYKQESRTLFCEGCNLGIIIAIMRRFIHKLRMARGSVGFFRRILYQRIRHDALDAIVSLCLAVYAERYFMLVLLPRPVWATFTGFTQLSCGACVIACSL